MVRDTRKPKKQKRIPLKRDNMLIPVDYPDNDSGYGYDGDFSDEDGNYEGGRGD